VPPAAPKLCVLESSAPPSRHVGLPSSVSKIGSSWNASTSEVYCASFAPTRPPSSPSISIAGMRSAGGPQRLTRTRFTYARMPWNRRVPTISTTLPSAPSASISRNMPLTGAVRVSTVDSTDLSPSNAPSVSARNVVRAASSLTDPAMVMVVFPSSLVG